MSFKRDIFKNVCEVDNLPKLGYLFIDFFLTDEIHLGRLKSTRINLNKPLTARSTLAIDSEFCVSFRQWTDKDGWIWLVSPLSAAVPIFRERHGTSISCTFRHCLKQYTIRRHSWMNGGCATVCLGNIRYVTMGILIGTSLVPFCHIL